MINDIFVVSDACFVLILEYLIALNEEIII